MPVSSCRSYLFFEFKCAPNVQGRSPRSGSLLARWRDRQRELSRVVETRDEEREAEREKEKRKENTLAGARLHGVTRKYDAPKASRRGIQRGHDVSIPSSPREPSLEGPRGTRCSPHPLLPDATIYFPHTALLPPHDPPCDRALFARSRSPPRKSVQDVRERGTTHQASQITPLSKSPDLLASVYVVQRVVTTARSFAERETTFLFCVLYSYIPLSRSRRAFRLGGHRSLVFAQLLYSFILAFRIPS